MEKLFSEPGLFPEDLIPVFKQTLLLQANWKWLVLFTALILGYALRPLLQYLLKQVKIRVRYFEKHPQSFWTYFARQEVERPLAWILVIALWFIGGEIAELKGNLAKYYGHLLNGLLAFHVIGMVYFAVDAIGQVMMDRASKTPSSFDDQLASFSKKAMKILVVTLGLLIVLQSFGLNVMSLLAGLGLGGLALALAAQDTAANVFGSITILFDQPFKVGDQIKVGAVEGIVEEVGFRSTRVRTFYNSLISIPNSIVAKETVDNMGVRPARRIRQDLGLSYDTPPEKIVQFCDSIKYLLVQQPKVRRDSVTVNFNRFDASSLNVLVNFHLEVATGDEELALQQALFLEFLKLAADLKVDFAYPTTTVYYKNAEALANG